MSRTRAPLLDDAFDSLLANDTRNSPAQQTDLPASSAAPGSEHPISGERLIELALEGHSPSARALANEGDSVVALAESVAAEPPSALRERILRGVTAPQTDPGPALRTPSRTLKVPTRSTLPLKSGASSSLSSGPGRVPIAATTSPNEALGRMHANLPEEARRKVVIDRHGMRGGVGQEATDQALRVLIDQYSPFLGFEVVFVSTVDGDVTIHRVHSGFPAELGDIDVVPRELSFCTHTVSSGEPFVVEDAAKEPFFRQSDLVRKLGARAYLGVPLFARAEDGGGDIPLGALCGISRSPQVIFPEDVVLAQRFARIAQALVTHDADELRRLVAEPAGYPTAAPGRPIVLSKGVFRDIVEAQRQRIGAAATTWLVTVPVEKWSALSTTLPPSLVAGVLSSTEANGLLLPEDHPAFEQLVTLVDGSGVGGKRERLG